MNFYITLPSNGADTTSEYGKKHNTQTDFSTELKETLVFDNYNYEVALVECSYRKNWIINLGSINVYEVLGNDMVLKERFLIYMFDGVPMNILLSYINENLNRVQFIYDSEKNKGLVSLTKPCNVIMTGYIANIFRYSFLEYKQDIASNLKSYKDLASVQSKIIQYNADTPQISLLYNQNVEIKFRMYSKILKYVEEIFVGTNIVKESYVGRSMAPLLKTLTDSSEFDQIVAHQIINPHYVSINFKTIDKIRIFMQDSNGDNINFTDSHSRVVYKLHFRPSEEKNID